MKRSTTVSHWFARRAVPAIVAVIAIAFVVMAGFLVQIGTTLDRKSAERAEALVETALKMQGERIREILNDYAGWGEAYRHLHPVVDLDWAFEAENAGPTLFTDFELNYLIVIGPENTTNYAVVDGKLVDTQAEKLLTGGLERLIARARESGTETAPVDGILLAGDKAVLAAAAVISPAEDPNVEVIPGPTSVLVMGYTLTAAKLAAIGDGFFVPGLRPGTRIPDAARKALLSEDGSRTATLEWVPERAGRDLLRHVLPWLGAAAALLALLTWLVLRHALQNARLLDRSTRKLAAAHAKAEHLAMHDVVTGLPNRAMLMNHLDEALTRDGENTALLYLDLDRFKPVNDALGHHAGDQVLIELARRLKSVIRDDDIAARVGGDEFVVTTSVPSANDAEALCRRLHESVTQPFVIEGSEIQIGLSIGVAIAPLDAQTPGELIRRADIAMYQAKNERQTDYRFYSADMNDKVQARRALEIDLRRALANHEFKLHFQPRFETATCRISGVEALIRWQHPERGLVPPADFIPLAEETGLIVPIGAWALREACTVIAEHRDVVVSVNLSPVQFRSDLVGTVRRALDASGLPPRRLELELTEGVLLENTDSALHTLRQLKAIGIGLAMDDFGTGYSSLGYLQVFPFDRIKIDRTFVSKLTAKGGSRPIIHAILGLGRALDMTVTAEGVETAEQFLLLRADQCSEVQGYLLARPMPAEALREMLCKSPEEIQRSIAA